MKTIAAGNIKASFTWKAENAPVIDPNDPVVEISSGSIRLIARISPKQARKLQAHRGGGKIEGKLIVVDGRLELAEASAQLFDPKPVPATEGAAS